jgi:NADPH-dependent 2,4-dienoyl-CoA reductase/sulfur reductase-like enzyme
MIHDLAIIGAGPAGMAAAIAARGLGLGVAVIDEQPGPGGQVFRGIEGAAAQDKALGADSAAGAALARGFRACGAETRFGTTLWHLEPDGEAGLCTLALADAEGTAEMEARRVILATGAQERPVPIPGWQLPGVMTAGAAQIMLKTAGAVPAEPKRTVLAGQGPLLWLLAVQMLRAGAAPALILETRPAGRMRESMGLAWGALAGGGGAMLWKGARLLAEARLAIPIHRGTTGLRAEGDQRLRHVAWDGGRLACDLLLLHEGVIPATHVPMAIGLDHRWDAAQRCWRPVVDAQGATSHPRIAIAGDGAGIGGWEAAMASGRIAALDAARRLGRIDEAGFAAAAAPAFAAQRRALALRPFLDAVYAPGPAVLCPPEDATIACRCEEVTAGQVRAAARLGATGPNQAKAYLRCGMGACQGRLCGPTVAALIEAERGMAPGSAGLARPRAPYKPITVGALAGLAPVRPA